MGFVVTMPDGWSLHFETAHTVQTDSQALKSVWSTTIKPVLVLSPSNFTHILCFLLSDPETVDLHMTRICHHILTCDMCRYVGTTAIWLSSVGMEDEEEQ